MDNEVLKYWVYDAITPDTRSKKYEALVLVILGSILIILLTVVPRGAQSKADSIILELEFTAKALFILTAAGLLLLLLNELRPQVRRMRRSYKHLSQTRTVIEGDLVSLEWRGFDITYRDRCWKKVTARYTFVSPTTGVTLSGAVQRKRPDLRRASLPAPGTPVRVLYADDDAYMML